MSRAAVFIDGGYLAHLLRPFGEPTIAFDRLAAELTSGDDLLRAYYYDCPPYQSPETTPKSPSGSPRSSASSMH